MSNIKPILVSGAAGSMGSVGRTIVQLLRQKDLPVRALVHRLDERAQGLKDLGAEIVLADLTNGAAVVKAMQGCRRVYFGMSLTPLYLQAATIAASAAKQIPNFEAFVNISQMTVSQMSLTNMTESDQQKLHWLSEQVLNWSGLPVVHLRSTVFLEHFFFSSLAANSIAKNGTISLPFGSGRTSPIAAADVARVAATILASPKTHIGKVYELTGPRSQDMNAIAAEYAEALDRPVKYISVPFDQWYEQELMPMGLPAHVQQHVSTMAKLHAENRYDRLTTDVEKVTGKPPISIREYVANALEFRQTRRAAYL